MQLKQSAGWIIAQASGLQKDQCGWKRAGWNEQDMGAIFVEERELFPIGVLSLQYVKPIFISHVYDLYGICMV